MKKRTHSDVQIQIRTHQAITLVTQFHGVSKKHVMRCDICNYTWQATLNNIIRGQSGCPNCSKKVKRDVAWLRQQLDTINSTRVLQVLLISTTFTRMHDKVIVRCQVGHEWASTPSNLVHGQQGCKVCSGKSLKTTEQFRAELAIARPDLTLPEDSVYVSAHHKISVTCPRGHSWSVRAVDTLQGVGCIHCARRGYSIKAIRWLDYIMNRDLITIQHAENGGEFNIPGTKWFVDGYCRDTNTVYEFYGTVYHGDLKLIQPEKKCHPFNKKVTAQYLYNKTMNREQHIRELGYNVVTIWEREYDSRH